MKGLWACSYALGSFERKVLVRRAGLEGFEAASVGSVANQLGASLRRVRRAQSRGVRLLRGANRADGCAMPAPAAGLGGSATTLLAVATAPALATDAGEAVARASKPSETNDRAEVLGARRTGVKVSAAPRATVSLAAAGDDGPALWLLILLALLALATPLLLRRGREVTPAAPASVHAPPPLEPTSAPVHVPPPPDPTPAPEPTPDPVHSLPPWERAPAPPPVSAVPAEDASPPSPAPRKGPGRAAGLAVTGLASLAVTLLTRARRKR